MTEKERNDYFYVCALIEYIARETLNHRGDIVSAIGRKGVEKLLHDAEVDHCLSFEQVSDEVICSMNTALSVIEMELSLKYKKKVRAKKTITDNDMVFQYGEKHLARLSERNVRVIGIMDKPGYEGMLRGRFSTPLYAMKKDDYIFVQNGDEKIKTDRYKCKKQLYILDELMRNYKNAGFVVRIPEEWKEIQFGIHTNDADILLNKVEVNSEDKQENEDE